MRCITQCNASGQAREYQCDSLKPGAPNLERSVAFLGAIALSQRRTWTACETTWPRV